MLKNVQSLACVGTATARTKTTGYWPTDLQGSGDGNFSGKALAVQE